MINIIKRTFEANKHPKGSQERIKLNEEIVTSEYQPSYKYILEVGGKYQLKAFRTNQEAKEYIK